MIQREAQVLKDSAEDEYQSKMKEIESLEASLREKEEQLAHLNSSRAEQGRPTHKRRFAFTTIVSLVVP